MAETEDLTRIRSISKEPFVFLEDAKHLSNWDKSKEVIYNQQMRQKEKLKFYRNAFEFLRSHSIAGDYFEFGCHRVRTFRMALTEARKKNMQGMSFYALDSFEGLPDYGDNLKNNLQYNPQMLSTSEKDFMSIIRKHGIYVNKVKTIKGFYEDTLTKGLRKEFKAKGVKAALVTVDCSLYKSFVSVFGFIDCLLQEGTVIYIDDYRVTFKGSPVLGAPKAFNMLKKRSAFGFDPFLDIGWFGKSFIVYKKKTGR